MADFINYANIAPQDLQSGLPDIFKNVLQGYQMAKAPGDMAIGRQKSIADAMLAGLKAQAYPEESKADIAYKQAEAYKALHPEQYFAPQGPAAEVLARQRAVNQFGENSEQVRQIDALADLNRRAKESTISRNDALSQSQAFRSRGPLEKLQSDREIVASGVDPITGNQLTPNEQQRRLNAIDLQMQKTTTDATARQKTLYAANIDKTLANIDPNILTQYSGPQGQFNLKKEQAKAAAGNPSDEYLKYQDAVTAAQLLAKQVRQFYGDSIQPSVAAELEFLSNPSSWLNSPKTAMHRFNAFKNLLKAESGTYQAALKSTSPYQGGSSSTSAASPSNKYSVYLGNGQWGEG